MIVDTSAIIAILVGEPEADELLQAIAHSPRPRMSAATYLEAGVVIDRAGDPVKTRRLDAFIAAAGIEVVDVSREQAVLARQAYQDYGKGSGHRAGLNFGDCFAYALAGATGEPLLFKGDDFGHTDITSALKS